MTSQDSLITLKARALAESVVAMKWRIVGLVVACVAMMVVLPMTQPDRSAAVELTAQELVRSHVGDMSEALEGPQVVFSYEGVAELEAVVWKEVSRVASLESVEAGAPELRVTTELASAGYLVLSMELDGLSGLDSEEPVVSEGSQRVGDWQSILPPLSAILAALFLRKILLAMAAGVWFGAVVVAQHAPLSGTVGALGYVGTNLTDSFNLYIIGFTFALVGMVHVMIRMGAMAGVLELFSSMAQSARSTRIVTALMGFVIFFDDYANTIVVGTTMRPLSDARRISREKLAYIVDSTSAPIAGLAIISTWIGYEVGLFEELSRQLHLGMSGYEIFLGIIPLRFYCIFALAFVLWNVFMSRDFGPMLRAERRATETGALLRPGSVPLTRASFLAVGPKEGVTARWINAAIPVGVVIAATMGGMFWSGWGGDGSALAMLGDMRSWEAWQGAFSDADGAKVLFWASVLGTLVAISLAVGQGLLSVGESVKSWLKTVPSMWMAVAILVLAWSIRSVCDDLGTSIYLVGAVDGLITLTMLPLLTFVVAALVAFATGTSWGAMGILLPTMIPLAFQLGDGTPHSTLILMLCFAAVLDGAIYGDHCSPISDTTVMSSIAAGSDHIDHVRTQMPYATVAMLFAAGVGYVGVAMGLSPWVALPVGIVGLGVVLRVVGR